MIDFISELTLPLKDDNHTLIVWILFIDDSATLERGNASLVLKGPDQLVYDQAFIFKFKISNIEDEYEMLNSKLNSLENSKSKN